MKIWSRGIIGVLAVLVIGIVLGIVFDRAILAHGHGVSHGGHEAEHRRLVEQLRSDLDLTEAQKEGIELILQRQQAAVDSAWLHVRDHLHNSVDSVRHSVERVLTPAQRSGFSEWWDRHHPENGEDPGPHGNHN